MSQHTSLLSIASILALLLTISPASGDVDFVARAGDSASEVGDRTKSVVVTEQNVYEQEANWPNIIAMTKRWSAAEGGVELSSGYRGALVRVGHAGYVRIDFGRHGQHEVPVDHTDLVARANEVREGSRHKSAPIFVLQVGTRLVDPSNESLRPLASVELADAETFLCVFANPTQEDFPALARRLADLREVPRLEMILFPQSIGRGDLEGVKTRLTENGLPVPFVYPHLSADYTDSLLGDEVVMPYGLLVTPNGRVLLRGSLDSEGALSQIRDAASEGALSQIRDAAEAG